MAEKKDDDKGTGTGAGGGGGDDKAGIRAVVAEVLGDLFKGGKADVVDTSAGGGKGRGRDDAGDIGAQVDAAVKRVRERDARDAAEKAREERLAKLEEQVQKPEREPKVVRRVTSFMWGGDDD